MPSHGKTLRVVAALAVLSVLPIQTTVPSYALLTLAAMPSRTDSWMIQERSLYQRSVVTRGVLQKSCSKRKIACSSLWLILVAGMLAEEEAADFVQNLRAICPLGSPFMCPFQAFSVGWKESWFTQADSPTVCPEKLDIWESEGTERNAGVHRSIELLLEKHFFHAFQLISFYKSGKSIHSFDLICTFRSEGKIQSYLFHIFWVMWFRIHLKVLLCGETCGLQPELHALRNRCCQKG